MEITFTGADVGHDEHALSGDVCARWCGLAGWLRLWVVLVAVAVLVVAGVGFLLWVVALPVVVVVVALGGCGFWICVVATLVVVVGGWDIVWRPSSDNGVVTVVVDDDDDVVVVADSAIVPVNRTVLIGPLPLELPDGIAVVVAGHGAIALLLVGGTVVTAEPAQVDVIIAVAVAVLPAIDAMLKFPVVEVVVLVTGSLGCCSAVVPAAAVDDADDDGPEFCVLADMTHKAVAIVDP